MCKALVAFIPGKWGILFPLILYATPTLISSNTSRMSSLVKAMLQHKVIQCKTKSFCTVVLKYFLESIMRLNNASQNEYTHMTLYINNLNICSKPHNPPLHSRREAVYHVSVFEDDQVQPATAALPSRGDPYLMTPGLKQFPHCL